MKVLWAFISDQRGVATIEYALLLAFIGTAIALATVNLSMAVDNELNTTTIELTD